MGANDTDIRESLAVLAMVAGLGLLAMGTIPEWIGYERDAERVERAALAPVASAGEGWTPAESLVDPAPDAGLLRDELADGEHEELALPSFARSAPARKGTAPSGTGGSSVTGRFDCLIQSKQRIDVGSSSTGVVDRIFVERGDVVEAGQLLAELDSKVEVASAEVSRLRSVMDGDLRASEANERLSRSREARAQKLFEASTLSVDDRDEMATEAELAAFEVRRAREEKRLAAAELALAQQLVEQRRIRSPIAGVVVETVKLPGEVVREETVLTVAQIDPLQVEVVLPAALFGEVKPGMRAEVVPELPEAGSYVATVDIVDPVIDAASGTFRVRLELPNPDHALPSGLHCETRFLSAE